MPGPANLIGERYGRLTVVADAGLKELREYGYQ
jgi:hypothetical protein